jgi:hypothetical protein
VLLLFRELSMIEMLPAQFVTLAVKLSPCGITTPISKA